METLALILATLKILGALLYVALAVAFRSGAVFSSWFRGYLIIQAITVVSYSQDTARVAEIRTTHPAGFAFGTLPFLLLLPLLFLSVKAAGNREMHSNRLTMAIVISAGIIVVVSGLLPGFARFLPGPGSLPLVSYLWNTWHFGWIAASVPVLAGLKRNPETSGNLEPRILSWLTGLAGLTILASAVLEAVSYRLDFLVTPLFMILSAYAALGILISRAPVLMKQGRKRYAGSDLNPEAAGILAEKAKDLLETGDLWRDGTITLAGVAASCASSPRDLSQAVNHHFSMGFSAWINSYRLDETERLLEKTDMKIADIALTAGFNSLSSFNTSFRKRRSVTPGEWRKARRLSDS